MSNEWGPAPQVKIEGDTADIIVGYSDKGTIDSALRYSPAAKTDAIKTSAFYHLVMVPTYAIMYAPDGKTVISKKPTGSRIWQIQGSPSPPWTTVNTAIRYVLEMKNKAADPSVRRNADQTLSSLLKLQ
jgi:hypothetical protein